VTRITRLSRRFSALGVATLFLAVLAGCTTTGVEIATPESSVSAMPSGDGVLRIGTLMPRTGAFAFLSGAQTAAVALAIADINAAGGVNGKPVELLAGDSGDTTSTTAETSFADLVKRGAGVVIGPTSSVLASRLLPPAVAAQVTIISPAATYPELSSPKDNGLFFRTIPSFGAQGTALARAMSAKAPVKAALVYVSDDLSASLIEPFRSALSVSGSTLVIEQPIAPDASDLSKQIAAVVASKPDAVVLSSAYSTFDLTKALITQLIGAGFSGAKLWLTTQNTGDYSQAFPNGTLSGVNGIIEGAQPDAAFTARLKALDGSLTSLRYAPEAYDATVLAALAAATSGSTSGRAISQNLRDVSHVGIKCTSFAECLSVRAAGDDMDYDGPSGEIDFTSGGDPGRPHYGLHVFDGENRFVYSSTVIAR
jgi:branched-chain amino acid transport system substrate-binding protein